MVKLLVTGGAGYIGSHTCLDLLQKGYELVVIDSLINSSSISLLRVKEIICSDSIKLRNKLTLIEGDVRDYNSLDKIFKDSLDQNKPIQGVIHFAGLKSVGDSVVKPLSYYDVNVNGSINLFRAMDKYACRTVVFSSSATIYSSTKSGFFSENAPLKPSNPYGQTKFAVEKILESIYQSNNKWRILNLRYFNPIGAHPSGKIGESPLGAPTNLLPYITQVAIGNLNKLRIYGNDWPTYDGTGVRDYIHVMDVAEGHSAAMEFLLSNNSKFISLNLGTGIGTSVKDLIRTFEATNKCEVPIEITNRRSGDVPIAIANNELARSILSWKPLRSLEESCSDSWKWQKLNPNGYV